MEFIKKKKSSYTNSTSKEITTKCHTKEQTQRKIQHHSSSPILEINSIKAKTNPSKMWMCCKCGYENPEPCVLDHCKDCDHHTNQSNNSTSCGCFSYWRLASAESRWDHSKSLPAVEGSSNFPSESGAMRKLGLMRVFKLPRRNVPVGPHIVLFMKNNAEWLW